MRPATLSRPVAVMPPHAAANYRPSPREAGERGKPEPTDSFDLTGDYPTNTPPRKPGKASNAVFATAEPSMKSLPR